MRALSSRSVADERRRQGISGPLNAADIAAINAGTYRFSIAPLARGRRHPRRGLPARHLPYRRRRPRLLLRRLELRSLAQLRQVQADRGHERLRRPAALPAGARRGPQSGHRADPVPLAVRPGRCGRLRPGHVPGRIRASPGPPEPAGPSGRGHRGLRPLQSVRRRPTTRLRSAYFTRHAHTERVARAVRGDRLRLRRPEQLFELPGGPIRFAIGAEYRKEDGTYFDDPFLLEGNPSLAVSTQTNTNAVVIGNFDPPAFKVKEAFGEIQIPLLKDMFLAHELTVSGAARVARLQRRDGYRLGLQCRRRLRSGPGSPVPRQLQPGGSRSEPFGAVLPAGRELRAGLRRSLLARPASAPTRTARPTASRRSAETP